MFARIEAEWERTNAALTLITGEKQRLAGNPSLARSIEHRFPYLDPLNRLQVELMRRYRTSRKNAAGLDRVEHGIHISINGLAAGLRDPAERQTRSSLSSGRSRSASRGLGSVVRDEDRVLLAATPDVFGSLA